MITLMSELDLNISMVAVLLTNLGFVTALSLFSTQREKLISRLLEG